MSSTKTFARRNELFNTNNQTNQAQAWSSRKEIIDIIQGDKTKTNKIKMKTKIK